jgi:hypothetical protein
MERRFVFSWAVHAARPMAGLALLAVTPGAPAMAQDAESALASVTAQTAAPASCSVFAENAEADGVQIVRAICAGRVMILGPTTSYSAIPNRKLGATVVDMRMRDERRVLLLSIDPEGLPLVEDISGQIALAAGRGPMSDIADVTVEPGEFASSGRIAVQADARAQAAPGEVRRIALDEQLARERSR